ncbi:MAG: DUF4833 domain-containing protein [Bacteroidota bacterium]
MKNTIVYFLLAVCLMTGTSFSFLSKSSNSVSIKQEKGKINAVDTFPVPPATKNMLFYVQRTHNTNTIVYDLNYNKDSTLNRTKPVHFYWIRYADGGGKQELSTIQRKYAYGLNAVCIDTVKSIYKLNFVSYKKRDIFLIRSSKTSNSYKACITINNKLAYLHRVFAQIEGGTFWVPHITYVELSGYDISSGKAVSERIIP